MQICPKNRFFVIQLAIRERDYCSPFSLQLFSAKCWLDNEISLFLFCFLFCFNYYIHKHVLFILCLMSEIFEDMWTVLGQWTSKCLLEKE